MTEKRIKWERERQREEEEVGRAHLCILKAYAGFSEADLIGQLQ